MRSVVNRNVIMQRIHVTLARIVDCAAYRLHRNEVHTLRGHLYYFLHLMFFVMNINRVTRRKEKSCNPCVC
jgi:hypothetical protein